MSLRIGAFSYGASRIFLMSLSPIVFEPYIFLTEHSVISNRMYVHLVLKIMLEHFIFSLK